MMVQLSMTILTFDIEIKKITEIEAKKHKKKSQYFDLLEGTCFAKLSAVHVSTKYMTCDEVCEPTNYFSQWLTLYSSEKLQDAKSDRDLNPDASDFFLVQTATFLVYKAKQGCWR